MKLGHIVELEAFRRLTDGMPQIFLHIGLLLIRKFHKWQKETNMEPNRFKRTSKVYNDNDYIEGLKRSDADTIQSFFYSLCSFTLNDIRWSLMQGRIDYDELVNELYLYMSVDNWRKLDTFKGKNNCTLKSWMVRLAWRFFMQQRTRLLFEGYSSEYEKISDSKEPSEDSLNLEIAMDVESTFKRMANKRYVQVLKWMLVDGYDADEVAKLLDTSVSNIYNIKHRAIVQFVETYNR